MLSTPMSGIRTVLLAVLLLGACGDSEAAGPEPGSPAAQLCDIGTTIEQAQAHDPTGEDTVEYGGIYYSVRCLGQYSWSA